ncbi:helix-turn-helix domain-containing protein [Luteolibacter marinus]|uniref:helix-turn-helix domain-containing protein n=1 Tax=Luteolibacter marinus TaxID=2776705 RepID=UPI001868A414|nr:helix-turn-helix domain-containing protein [Luteolibacter marinus]
MKRPDLQIAYRNGRVVAIRARDLEAEPLGPIALKFGFKVKPLCVHFEVSERQLHRIFTDSLGISPKDWLRRERMVQARQHLLEGMPVKEAAVILGFPSTKDFSREFQLLHEVTPTDFQRRQDAERERRLE